MIGGFQDSKPDFSGTWELTKIERGPKLKKFSEKRTIKHDDPTIEIEAVTVHANKKVVSEFTYFTDQRGEKNFSDRDKVILTTKTRWRRKTILVEYKAGAPVNGDEKNRMTLSYTIAWRLSKDKRKMTETFSVRSPLGIKFVKSKRIYSRID